MAQESYLDRYREDYALSEQDVIQRINSTLYDAEENRPVYRAFPYTPSHLRSIAPQTRSSNSDEIDEKKMAEYKKVWDAYPRIEQPADLSIRLFPHQLVSVHSMETLERVRKVNYVNGQVLVTDFGILGDIPGYGKSYSVVTLLLRDKMEWDVSKPHERSTINMINPSLKLVSKHSSDKKVKANLLLASPTLIAQWKEYFSYIKDNKLKIKEISSRKDMEEFDPNEWDVVIVNTTRYNELMDVVGNVVWKRFIFDEAGSTHITSMRHIKAGFTWFVTATPEMLLCCSGTYSHYMRSFFLQMDINFVKYLTIKNPTLFVKHSFRMPQVIEKQHICHNPRVLNVLSSYIDSETRVMISAGDIKGAISRLGGGSANDTNLFEIVSRRLKEKISQAKFSLDFWKTRPNSQKDVEAWEKKVKEYEKTLVELEEKYKNVLEEDCTICYTTIDGPVLTPCCQNVFCGRCIIKWLETSHNTCPMCRSAIKASELVYISKDNDAEDEKKEDKSVKKPKQKQETVREIVSAGLSETPKKKFLIFSMYDESFSLIRRELEENKIDYVEISGAKATRDAKIKKFKEDKVNVVFLNSRFNGAGINLEMATDIILYHEMPAPIREQVVGRALRVGRECDLTIHNLIYEQQ
jgi:hypothetical protein